MYLYVMHEDFIPNIKIADIHLNFWRNELSWAKILQTSSYPVKGTTFLDIKVALAYNYFGDNKVNWVYKILARTKAVTTYNDDINLKNGKVKHFQSNPPQLMEEWVHLGKDTLD